MMYKKMHLTNDRKLYKHSVVVGTPSKVSRVVTLLDLVALIKKDVPAATIDIDPTKTSKVYTLPSWVEGIGTQNIRSKVATWEDAVTFIIAAGGTINIDLGPVSGSGIATTTTEMVTRPGYMSDGYSLQESSEFITYTEMTHLMNNSTFV